MSYELANPSPVTLAQIVDDLQTYHETLEMLQASLVKSMDAGMGFIDPALSDTHDGIAECEAKIASIGAALDDKTDAIAAVLRRIRADKEITKSEEARQHRRGKILDAADEWLCQYTLRVIEEKGIPRLKTALNTLYPLRSEATVITDAKQIPDSLKMVTVKLPMLLWRKISMGVDTVFHGIRPVEDIPLTPIKKAIKAGEEVPGADLKWNTNLVVR